MNNNLINQISRRVPNYTNINDIPNNLKNAVVATEDRRFYQHGAFDFISIGRALITDIKEGKFKEGGSTITQQLAKNLFLSNDKTIKRKFKEIFFTMELERRYTKDQILEMYLNVIYYGSNVYGVENASERYFNKSLKKLSLSECSMLAGIPQAPNDYNPEKHIDKAKKRQKIVLNAMVKSGFINKKVQENAWNKSLVIN
ncbi:transglycosylase domain-containing protein [Clostridium neuense]|uniref:Penicillin-binding protein 1A n=2 Tax=Clostridium neuense TaxID=1728934 RepID=A0ABW8TLL1_9CLOT